MVSSRGFQIAPTFLALVAPSVALGVAPGQIKNFVTFGDSYTDTSYYPTADGGYQWPTWAAEYGPFGLYGESPSPLLNVLLTQMEHRWQGSQGPVLPAPTFSLTVPFLPSWSGRSPRT